MNVNLELYNIQLKQTRGSAVYEEPALNIFNVNFW